MQKSLKWPVKNSLWFKILGQITATDADSGRFGQVEYALRGFGAEKFRVNEETGEIFVNGCGESENGGSGSSSNEVSDSCLDFESQKTYVLTYTGTDGGGQVINFSISQTPAASISSQVSRSLGVRG